MRRDDATLAVQMGAGGTAVNFQALVALSQSDMARAVGIAVVGKDADLGKVVGLEAQLIKAFAVKREGQRQALAVLGAGDKPGMSGCQGRVGVNVAAHLRPGQDWGQGQADEQTDASEESNHRPWGTLHHQTS